MNNSTNITPASMVILGVGWFGTQFFWGLHAASMPLFLKGFTDSKFRISLVLSLAGVAGCVIPPVVGYFSDRGSSKFGRRRPYIFFGLLGVFLCAFSLPHVSTYGIAAIMSGLMYVSVRVAETPYLSLLPDLTPPRQRSTASGVMNLFGSIGLITFFILGSRIWESHQAAAFRVVALSSSGTLLFAIALIKEPLIRPGRSAEGTAGISSYIKGLSEEANALVFFAAQFFWWFGFWMVSSFATLFAVEELKVSEGQSFLVLAVFSITATFFMLPLGMLGDRLGRKGILSVMIAFWAVSEVLVGFSQNLTHALITVGITAIPFAAVMGIGYAYMLDLIPGERTAEFVGMSIISIASAQIFGPLTGGKLIDNLGYRSIFPAAAVFMVIGLIILQFIRPGRVVGPEPVVGTAATGG